MVHCLYLKFIFICFRFEDVTLTPDKGIPTKSFLAACSSILPFFGRQKKIVIFLYEDDDDDNDDVDVDDEL